MFSKAVSIAAVVLTSIAPAAAIPLGKDPKHPLDSQHSHLPVGIPISSADLIARDVPSLTARTGGILPSGKPQVHDNHHNSRVPSGIPSVPGMPLYTPTVSNPLNWPLGIPVTESIKLRDAAWTAHPTVTVPQQALMTEVPLFTVAKGDAPDNVWVPPTVKGIRTTVFGEGMAKRDLPTLPVVPTPTLETVYAPMRIPTPTPTRKPQLKPGQEMSQLSKIIRYFLSLTHKLEEQKEKELHATVSSHTSGQVQLPDKTYHAFEDTAYHHPEQVHGGAKHEASHAANYHPSQVYGGAKHEASHIVNHHPDPLHGNLQHEASHTANHHTDPVQGNIQHGAIHKPTLQRPDLVLSPAQLRELTPDERRSYAEFHSKVQNAKVQASFEKFLRERFLHAGFGGEGPLEIKPKDSHESFHPGHIDFPEIGRSHMAAKAEKRSMGPFDLTPSEEHLGRLGGGAKKTINEEEKALTDHLVPFRRHSPNNGVHHHHETDHIEPPNEGSDGPAQAEKRSTGTREPEEQYPNTARSMFP